MAHLKKHKNGKIKVHVHNEEEYKLAMKLFKDNKDIEIIDNRK